MSDTGNNPAPGYRRKPDHKVILKPAGRRVTIRLGDTVVAESDDAVLCEETGHDPVYYLPMTDIRADLFRPTAKSTYCPFKGNASYWTIAAGGREAVDAAWSYDLPFDEAVGLRGHVAFYPGKVDAIETG